MSTARSPGTRTSPRHAQSSATIPAAADRVFAYLDDHRQFSAHMGESSWMMAGTTMQTELDAAGGRSVGSHVRMRGQVLGLNLELDEVITERDPPLRKVWETVGEPSLLVIGAYRMGVDLRPELDSTVLTVFIEYWLPHRATVLGVIFGSLYAKWCVNQMLRGVVRHFSPE
jgi:hypothetical protein